MKRVTAIIVFLATTVFMAIGQSYDADAVRFSKGDIYGTARVLGTGGAFSAIGADLSSVHLNPAGLGVYRKGEFSFTPNIYNTSNSSIFLNNELDISRIKLGINNIGFVAAKVKKIQGIPVERGIVAANFSLSYTSQANFNSQIAGRGLNSSNSISTAMIEELNNSGIEPGSINWDNTSFETTLGYIGWIANYDSALGGYTTPVTGVTDQSVEIIQTGNMGEINIALAANHSNKFYFGGAIGIPTLDYSRSINIIEVDEGNTNGDFQSLDLSSSYSVSGVGVNGQIGFIYRPDKSIRFGASIKSPSLINVDEQFRSSLVTDFDSIVYEENSPEGRGEYSLILPWKLTAGAAFFFDRYGFISVDYELTDHRKTSYEFENALNFENSINKLIDQKYSTGHHLRIGAEAAIDKFRLRGGYGMIFSPFADGVATGNLDLSQQNFTAGFGFREDRLGLDIAYVRSQFKQYNSPYSLGDGSEPGIQTTSSRDMVATTLTYKFK